VIGIRLVSAAPAAISAVLDVVLGRLRRRSIDVALENDGPKISGPVAREQRDPYLKRVEPGDDRP
jgi:hypothetical protein